VGRRCVGGTRNGHGGLAVGRRLGPRRAGRLQRGLGLRLIHPTSG
jgi:hypothetical protein